MITVISSVITPPRLGSRLSEMSQTPLVNPFFRFDRVGPYEGRALQETPSYLRHAYLSLTLASCVCQVASLSVHVTKLRHKNYKTNKSQEATKFLTTKKSAVEHIKKQPRNTSVFITHQTSLFSNKTYLTKLIPCPCSFCAFPVWPIESVTNSIDGMEMH